MHGCRQYVGACCRGTTLAALLIADPAGLFAQSAASDDASQIQHASSPQMSASTASSLGAHTLLAQSEGLGTSPATTQPIDTQANGSALLVFNGGYSSNASRPIDTFSNHWKQLGNDVPFGNGYGDRFNVKAYLAMSAHGGAAHTVSLSKPGNAVGEISIPFIEIKNAGVLKDVAQNYAPTGLKLTSHTVTTTGPATLIAVWWGDGGLKRMTAVPDNGFRVIDSYLTLPDNSGVQVAVASRQVETAGTYNVSWLGAPVQGAILWLFAFQSH